MGELEQSRVVEICALHEELAGLFRQSLEKAIRLGELLAEQKKALKHKEFGCWVRGNLPFSARTARRYMRLHRERDRLKTDTVSDLTGAYRLLASPAVQDIKDIEETRGEKVERFFQGLEDSYEGQSFDQVRRLARRLNETDGLEINLECEGCKSKYGRSCADNVFMLGWQIYQLMKIKEMEESKRWSILASPDVRKYISQQIVGRVGGGETAYKVAKGVAAELQDIMDLAIYGEKRH